MKNLADVLTEFKQKHPLPGDTMVADVIQKISQDQDLRDFWQVHQNEMKADAFEVKMMDLFEYIQQKNAQAQGLPSLYPGYQAQLAIEKGYPQVVYQPSEQMQKKLNQKAKLRTYQVPKAIAQADLAQIAEESAQDGDRTPALTATIQVLKKLVAGEAHYVPGLYLAGDFGVGKTYLMGALANALAANQIGVLMLHFPSFINNLKATFNKPNQSLEDLMVQAKTVPVLILDDIGADTLTAWSRDDILGVILEYRMQNELTTCFTSNFNLESLEQYLAQTRDGQEPVKAARLMQRIKYLARPVTMAGRNRRLES
ncbi:primosomal protein DnaI [Convivina praedatoris]|uniref:Primosomal protein DnaI n=1 Tax=Convivina praedatoris TaxID=2880963 RepID=A0ABM9D012_9LACO|nr:primosomal protein DnaI [Convivina sp. LMG 32447]CAH1850380.1 Primosomal protein DnaI [Convivina sp. LMG 32447]CAH1850816.1 Primosomal protein DnaI [Convivina sp. LMG 32447]CAH1850829.1 Primosomal protein DnaI [Convivina sp. LMG 32447]